MTETEVKVPNIGDFKDVEVIEVLVSEGQILKKNDPLITIESDKSSVEIPSNFEGKIKSLRTKVGDKVSEGDLILVLDSKSQLNEIAEEKQEIEKEFKKIKVIKPEIEQTQTKEIKTTSHDISSASPKARKFARELGVDISQVVGSEKDGRVIEDDIKKFVSHCRNLRNEITFGADIIAGFPTETDEMFRNTYELLKNCNISHLHIFPFSPKKNTPAARMPQLKKSIIKMYN